MGGFVGSVGLKYQGRGRIYIVLDPSYSMSCSFHTAVFDCSHFEGQLETGDTRCLFMFSKTQSTLRVETDRDTSHRLFFFRLLGSQLLSAWDLDGFSESRSWRCRIPSSFSRRSKSARSAACSDDNCAPRAASLAVFFRRGMRGFWNPCSRSYFLRSPESMSVL